MPLSKLNRFLLPAVVVLAGCSTSTHVPFTASAVPATGYQGALHGGQQPIVGATINIYTVGTTGDGTSGGSVLTGSVTTDVNGFFDLTGKINCASSTELLYLVATGGSPGVYTPPGNQQSSLIAALGPCNNPSGITYINVSEVTTVAAIYALAPYMTSLTAIGSGSSDAAALSTAFTLAWEFANINTGASPGNNVPSGTTVPSDQINFLANLLSACINSTGGVATDTSTICGKLLNLLTPSGGTAPTDTAMALRNLALNPSLNTQALYELVLPTAPFQPTITQQPPDFGVRLVVPSDFTVSPSALSFGSMFVGGTTAAQDVIVTNNTSNALTFTGITYAGAAGADFVDVSSSSAVPCSALMLPGNSCDLQIAFRPTAAGARHAYAVFKNTSANPLIAIPLSGTGTAPSAGPIAVSPSSLNLTAYNTPQSVNITNNGTTPLTIAGYKVTVASSGAPTSDVTASDNCGTTLAPNGTCSISVTLHPISSTNTETLTISSDASSGPQSVTLNINPVAGISANDSVNFGTESLGKQGNLPFTVYASSSGIGSYLTLTLTGANASEFSFSPTSSVSSTACSFPNASSANCNQQLYFNPANLGLRNAAVAISGYGNVPVSGTGVGPGPYFEVTPDSGSLFNGQLNLTAALGASSVSTVTARITGSVATSINPPTVSGPHASDFTSSGTCTNVSPGGTCSFTITYTPSVAAGWFAGTLQFADSTNTVQRSLPFSALSYPPNYVTASTNLLTFGSTYAGTISAPQSVTVTALTNNPVNAAAVIYNSATQSPYFAVTQGSSCSSTPCQVSVVFTPPANTPPGILGATLRVADPLTGGQLSISLQGTVVVHSTSSVSPGSLTFSSQAVNTTSPAQSVTVGNTDASHTLTFSGVSVTGTNPSDFILTNGCTASVAPAAQCTVLVQFRPGGSGPRNATLQIVSNSTSSPDTVSLSGTAP